MNFFLKNAEGRELSFEHLSVAIRSFNPEIQQQQYRTKLMRAIFILLLVLLISMGRRKVDAAQAQKACDAVRGGMSIRRAAKVYDIDRLSLSRRLTGEVAMKAKVGPGTVLSEEEENSLEDVLLYAGRHCLAVGRLHLLETVRVLCSDGRPTPWGPGKAPGKDWLAGFLKRHPRVSERSTRIYEANRITEDKDPRIVEFYKNWAAFLDEHKPKADHVHNTDETGEDVPLD